MDNIKVPNNSHAARNNVESIDTEKKIKPVVSGAKRKKNSTRKIKELFVSDEASNVKDYVFMDVLIPSIKKAVSDIIKDGIDMILYGGRSNRNSNGHNNVTDYVSYRSYYENKNQNIRPAVTRHSTAYDYDDIIMSSRGEAMDMLESMCDIIDHYGIVSVADMYDLAQITSNYTDYKYGWTNLSNADIIRANGGWTLKLPKVTPIN